MKETIDMRIKYYLCLKKLLHLAKWDQSQYAKAQIKFYNEILCENQELSLYDNQPLNLPRRFLYLLPYDLVHIFGMRNKTADSNRIRKIIHYLVLELKLPSECKSFVYLEFQAALGSETAWQEIMKSNKVKGLKRYLRFVKQNLDFIRKKPYKILITATMSAGKSTLINALVGKNISRVQNMACTSKIHIIISKSCEDNIISEYDHELSINASSEDLLTDNIENQANEIIVGTFFANELGGKRIILLDSPGVNSNTNQEHAAISQQMIKSRKYHLMIYVINATQLCTIDEAHHLDIVRQELGHAKIIFVINKADQLISEDDNLIEIIERQKNFLTEKGFKKPLICPISARAAYLIEMSKTNELSRIERREIDNLMDKFERQRLSEYYESYLGCPHISATTEMDALLVNCGFAYFEKIIESLYNGGKANGAGIC